MEITSVMTTLATAIGLAKDLANAKIDQATRDKAIALQSTIMEFQTLALAIKAENHALLDAKRDLEEQIRRMEEWGREEARYHLCELAPGVFAYALNPEAGTAEPAHLLCANCYQQRLKSILQRKPATLAGTPHVCHRCHAEILDHSTPAELVF